MTATKARKTCKACEPGFLPAKTAADARRFLGDLHRSCPIWITKILTDHGKEFTYRFLASRARATSPSQKFDQLCAELGIEHRMTPPKSPQTNGTLLGDCLPANGSHRARAASPTC